MWAEQHLPQVVPNLLVEAALPTQALEATATAETLDLRGMVTVLLAASRRDHVGHLVGVDAVIGLQGMAKPLHDKMKRGKLRKHAVIKSLDKLYQRQSYFPDENEFMVGDEPKLDANEKGIVSKPSTTTAEIEKDKKPDTVNFSQTKMDGSAKF